MLHRINVSIVMGLMITLSLQSLAKECTPLHYAKKGLKVTWHLAQIAVGGLVVFVACHDALSNLDIIDHEAISDMRREDYVIFSVLVPTALISGISGLNEELEIVKHIQQLIHQKKELHDKKHTSNV